VSAQPPALKTAGQIEKKLCHFGVVSHEADKYRVSTYGKKEEWNLIFERQLDRINRIVRIERPSAEGPLAAGEKNLYPVKS